MDRFASVAAFVQVIESGGFSAGPAPKPVEGEGQPPDPGTGKRAWGTPAEPLDQADQPDRGRPRLLRALRTDSTGFGGG